MGIPSRENEGQSLEETTKRDSELLNITCVLFDINEIRNEKL
jgi:hypothetical protein